MFIRFMAVVAVLWMADSCSVSKKAGGKETVTLDTLEVTVTRDNPYRASATQDFDLQHTRLEVKFNYTKQQLDGKATLTLTPHFFPQKKLVLDAKQFDIREVSLLLNENTRQSLRYTYDSLQITIFLDREYKRGEQVKVFIDYTAKPEERKSGGSAAIQSDKGLYFINPLGEDSTKPVQIWTQGETEASSCWFPTIDKPNQKTTQEIYITRDKKYLSLSNGTLVSTKENADGTVTDYWKMSLPHAPYLFMMTVGDFAITKDRWRDIAVDYYTEKEYAPYAKAIFGNTPEMMEFFSQKLGFDYPWSKYAQIVVRDYVSGAMENTSATLHGEFLQRNSRELLDETMEDIISHELFHQWFGDVVTCESWSNIPLNESFATYGEYLWNEYKYGKFFADYKQWQNYKGYLQESEQKNVPLIRFYYNDKEDMFDRHSYEKGGLILHYLRYVVGDEAFFKSLELYLKNNQFKSVEIHQLRLAFEEVTGRDMNWFFNQWFFTDGHPKLKIEYAYGRDSVFYTITQQHSTDKGQIYTLPMQLLTMYEDGQYDLHDVVINKKSQTFSFKANGNTVWLDADPARVVLCEREEIKTNEQYMVQYKTHRNFITAYEALDKLSEAPKTETDIKPVFEQALTDSFYYLREFAIKKIDLPKENGDSLLARIAYLAEKDPVSHVRKAAIEKLSKHAAAAKYEALFEKATGDSSYQVAAAALKALVTQNSKKAIALAAVFEKEKNNEITSAVADVYAKEGDVNYDAYFKRQLQTAKGYNRYSLYYYYANFLTRMEKPVVMEGIKNIVGFAGKEKEHWYTGAAKGALKRIAKWFDDKKKRTQNELSKEDGQTARLELQQTISSCDEISAAANDALKIISSKHSEEDE